MALSPPLTDSTDFRTFLNLFEQSARTQVKSFQDGRIKRLDFSLPLSRSPLSSKNEPHAPVQFGRLIQLDQTLIYFDADHSVRLAKFNSAFEDAFEGAFEDLTFHARSTYETARPLPTRQSPEFPDFRTVTVSVRAAERWRSQILKAIN